MDTPSRHAALTRLLEISRRLGKSSELTVVLEVIIDALRDLLEADRATVFTLDKAKAELVIHVAHGVSGTLAREIRIPATQGIAGACATSQQIVNIEDAYQDARFNPEIDRQTGYRTRSVLAIPLLDHEGELVGVAQVLNRRGGRFTTDDEVMAEGIAAQAAVALRRAHLIADHLEKVVLEREMDVAREIQTRSFPRWVPVDAAYDIVGHTTAATQCGGDAYDLFGVRDGTLVAEGESATTLAMLIADATGHGVGPALSSMQVRAMFRLAMRAQQGLMDTVTAINDQLTDDLPAARFITAWLGLLDYARARVECFSAGQGPVFVYRRASDTFEEIESNAPPFGIPIPGEFVGPPTSILLEPGDILLLLTDGYYEAMDPTGALWGNSGVQERVRALRDAPVRAVREALDAAVLAFARAPGTDDDRTAVIIKRLR